MPDNAQELCVVSVFVWCVCVCVCVLSAVSEAHSAIRLSKEELPLLSHRPAPPDSSLSAVNLISFLYLQAAFVVENICCVLLGRCVATVCRFATLRFETCPPRVCVRAAVRARKRLCAR